MGSHSGGSAPCPLDGLAHSRQGGDGLLQTEGRAGNLLLGRSAGGPRRTRSGRSSWRGMLGDWAQGLCSGRSDALEPGSLLFVPESLEHRVQGLTCCRVPVRRFCGFIPVSGNCSRWRKKGCGRSLSGALSPGGLTDASGPPVSLPSLLGDFLVFGVCQSLFLGALAPATPPSEDWNSPVCHTPNRPSKPVGTRGTTCPAPPS